MCMSLINIINKYPLVKLVNSVLGIAFNLAVNYTISDYGIDGPFLLILSWNYGYDLTYDKFGPD